MRLTTSLSVATLVAAGLVALPLSGAHADTTGITLPLAGYYQMAVDSAHGHLFFSQGSGAKNSILVTDFAGNTVTTITGQTGVKGITLSPDGSTLYAALSGGHAVTAISTATLQQTASYPVGNADTPLDVAVQSGKLWVSYDAGNVGSAAIGDFDLSAASPALTTQPAMGGWYGAPMLAADPSNSAVLVAVEAGLSPAPAASYDTSQNPVTVRAQQVQLAYSGSATCGNAGDIAVVPGGAQFIAACGAPYAHYRYSTADLSGQGAYASTNYPDAVTIASGNGLVAAGVDNNSADDIYVYAPGGDTPLNTYTTPQQLVARGLGITPDGSKLFAVTSNTLTGGSSYFLNVYDDPSLNHSALSLHGPASVPSGSAVSITGTLSFGDGSAVPSGTAISVTRAGPGGTGQLSATTAAGGGFTVTDKPPAAGGYTYTASYAGDSTHSAATATLTVQATLLAPALTLTATPHTATYQPAVRLTAHLGTTGTNRTVKIYAKPLGGNATFLVASGTVNSAGNLTASYHAKHSTTYYAVFSGDGRYAPKTVNVTTYVSARVTVALSGSYGSKRIGSTSFRLYHHTARLNLAALVAPNKHGQCVKIEIQEHYRGAWRADGTSGCGKLSGSSVLGGYLTLGQADLGYGYRIRVDYLRGSDVSNLSADSPWQYFMVEK